MFHDGPLIRDEEDYDILAAPCLEFLRCVKEQGKARKELVRWVLSWMPDVKVLAPKSLRDRIAEKLRDGLRAQQ